MSLPKGKPTITFKPKLLEDTLPEEKLKYQLEKWEHYKNWTSNSSCRLVLAVCKKEINKILNENLDIFFALHTDDYHKDIAEYCGVKPKEISNDLINLWDENKKSLINISLW